MHARKIITALCFAAALTVPLAASLYYFLWSADAEIARVVYTGAKFFLVLWPLVVVRFALKRPWPAFEWRDRRHLRALIPGALTGLAISALILGVMQTPLGDMVRAARPSIVERTAHLGVLERYWLFAVFLSIVHSLMEEYYWRWFVYGRMKLRIGRGLALALMSVAFASHHVVITGQLLTWPLGLLCGAGIAIGGALWAVLYDRHESIAGIWLSHAIVDFTVMAIGYDILMAT